MVYSFAGQSWEPNMQANGLFPIGRRDLRMQKKRIGILCARLEAGN